MMNTITWFILLFTIDSKPWVFLVLACWLLIGFGLTYVRGWGGVKQLFGSKVFGSASLILGLIKYGHMSIGAIWVFVLFGLMVIGVFALGHKLSDNDDRNEWF
jgi:hypothetical protein